MSFPTSGSPFVDPDNLLVQGRLMHRIRNIYPAGTIPSQAEHWLFDPHTIKAQTTYAIQLGGTVLTASQLALMGFWVPLGVAEGVPPLSEGDLVEAKLRLLRGVVPLAFYADSVVSTVAEKSRVQSDGCPANWGMPLEYDPGPFQIKGLLVEYNINETWLFNRNAEMQAAAAMWMQKTNAKISVNSFVTEPFAHYVVTLDDSLPGLARTQMTDSADRRPGRQSAFPLRIRTTWPWNHPSQPPGSLEFDFVTTFAHELGHALGLDHLDGNADNLMNSGIPNGIRKRFQPDDIQCMSELLG